MKVDADPNPMSRTIQSVLTHDAARLVEALALDYSTARIEVQTLLQHVLNTTRAYLLTYPERCLSGVALRQFETLLQRRLGGEPIAYLLGKREFFGLMLKVTPDTLIPRPESELLVELALQRIPPAFADNSQALQSSACPDIALPLSPRRARFRVLDLGTGSGAIALAIACTRPDVEVVALDTSAAALAVARENAGQLAIRNVRMLQSDWYSALYAQHFDLIVSNPPYISNSDPHLLQGDLRFEPVCALASGDDGLNDIRRISSLAPTYLNPGGWLMLEHGYDQSAQVAGIMRQAGFEEINSSRDLAGIERVCCGRWP
jgi:release factor glutamine methyltransferase